jgi:DNA-binding CsgD family transcriptional regulator
VFVEKAFEGWEEENPSPGKPYFLLLDSGRTLETSRVIKILKGYLVTNQAVYRFWEVAKSRREPSVLRRSPRYGDGDSLSALSPRERSIFLLLAKGLSVNEAADFLGISPKTAGFYKRHIMRKLKLESLSQLIQQAIKTGVLQLEP